MYLYVNNILNIIIMGGVMNTFNKEKIGNLIAKLITIIENKNYVFINAKYNYECIYYEEGYGYDSYSGCKNISIIINANNANNEYYDSYISEYGSMLNRDDIIVLPNNNKICFYDDKGGKVINTKKFDYVYDFIDYLINNDIDNNMLIEDYLNKNKIGILKLRRH